MLVAIDMHPNLVFVSRELDVVYTLRIQLQRLVANIAIFFCARRSQASLEQQDFLVASILTLPEQET
jgi:hypothetical protein